MAKPRRELTVNLTAKQLSGEHIGKTVTFVVPGFNDTPITGEIWHVYQMYDRTEILMPQRGTARVPHETPITIQEGQ